MRRRRSEPGHIRHMSICALPAACMIALASCNTTDALTPQVDVGGGMTQSGPVTQAETERMAANPPTGNSNARVAGGYGNDSYPPAPARRERGPQNSQEAQARAIENGSRSPIASTPLAPPAPPASDGNGQQQGSPPSPQAGTAPPPQQAEDAAKSSGTIRFLPIIGAPVQAVTPLSRQLGLRARAAGLTIKASGDASSEHILKGYLSAFVDGGRTTVVFVWDVLDASGGRLHRIQGQESVPGGNIDPWSAVPAETMEAIARETIDGYMEWRQM